VVGFLKTITNIHVLQRDGGQSSRMREIMIENVGNDPIDCDSTPCPVLVVVCSTFTYLKSSKCAQGKSTINIFDPDNRKTISHLLTAKWDPSCQAANVVMCNATTTNVLIESGWHYLACHRCSK
ncbi:hypothetical protein MKW98_002440, partial [Papaver atlanticum]